jgi:hypothetical protein
VLSDVEWGGDFVTGVVLTGLALGLIAFGFAWGRRRALTVIAVVWTVPLVASDILSFGFGVNLVGYWGEPECDPGPLPVSLLLMVLPVGLALTAAGVALRRRAMGATRDSSRA